MVAVIGFIQSNRANAQTTILGLTKTGLVLIGLSFVGLLFAIHDQVEQGRQLDKIAVAIGAAADQVESKNLGAASALRLVQGKLDQRGRNLDGTSFQASLVSAADFSFGRLENGSFHAADLTGSDFTHALLDNSRFSKASLVGADFSGVDLSEIIYDDETAFPNSQ